MNNINEPRCILIIQTAFLGDIVLTIPLIRVLKHYKPEAKILLLTTPIGMSLLEEQHIIDHIIVYDKKNTHKGVLNLFKKIKHIRSFKPDMVISPHRSFRSGIIALLSGAHVRIGYSLLYLTSFYNIRVKRNKSLHEVDRILSLLKPLNINITEEQRYPLLGAKKIKDIIDFIGIAPGSNWGTKQWTQEGYAELIRQLKKHGYNVLLIGSEKDKAIVEKIKKLAGVEVLDMVGSTSLKQLIDVLASIKLLITNDNGAMQVAQAVKTPIVAIFGPTIPEQGFAPIRKNTVIIENKGLYCRPCSPHGPMECPEGHFLCMQSITPEVVFRAVINLIENKTANLQ